MVLIAAPSSAMAFRPDEHVVRGEIDNRTRDRVIGRLWLIGRETPVELDLKGNAWADLAGRRLVFVNPNPQPGDTSFLKSRQRGVVGDCTASRKVKVPEVSKEKLLELDEARKPFPWHWGNSLYLEWFSITNGRVVIESTDYELTITDGPTWEMTSDEETGQRKINADALTRFMNRLLDAAEKEEREQSDEAPDDDDSPERPMTEEEAEAMQAESDKLADRIEARIEREGPNADYGKILEEELERRRQERHEEPLTPEQEAERDAWVDEMNRAAEEYLADPDPEFEAEMHQEHPLAEQAFELSARMWQDVEARHWAPEDASQEHPVVELINATSSASAKLAGALNGCTWPPEIDFCANHIVRLKRARGYLEDALLAAVDCADQHLIDPAWLSPVRQELAQIAAACDALITELRTKLERGFD